MKKLKEKIMAARFGTLFKKWMIALLCVTLAGGGLSTILLASQIREAAAAAQTLHQKKEQWEQRCQDTSDRETQNEEKRDGRTEFDAEDYLHDSISRPSIFAFLSVGATGVLLVLLAAAFWLGMAAWLYRTAALSGMNTALWTAAGLCGNVFAAALFLVVRGFLREKCPACGHWQEKSSYCSYCGEPIRPICPSCGASCRPDSRYCTDCGKQLHEI